MASQNLVSWQRYERVSLLDAGKIARLDYESFVSDNGKGKPITIDEFSSSNSYGYYVLLNTWLGIAFDLGGIGTANALLATIRRHGTLVASTMMKHVGDRIIRRSATADWLPSSRTAAIRIDFPDLDQETPEIRELVTRVAKLPIKFARQICVYPKRFAPIVPQRCSVLHEQAIAQFEATNKANIATEYRVNSMAPLVNPQPEDVRLLPFRSTSVDARMVRVAKLARQICHLILGEYDGILRQHQSELPRFGPGACRNAGRGLVERYERCVQYGYYTPMHLPELRAFGTLGVTYRSHPDVVSSENGTGIGPDIWSRGFWGTSKYPQVCAPSSVPKTQWANRLIAVEDICNQSNQLHVKDDMQRRFDATVRDAIPVRNQEVNREMARIGALTDKWATLDLSHASDSVTKPLVRMLVPSSWWDHAFQRCIPYGYVLFEGARPVVRGLHMFATMGCGCTFNVEAMVFYSLTLATCILEDIGEEEQFALSTINQLRYWAGVMAVHVMGDDIICLSRYARAVIAVLAYFGFEVNVDKSFLEGRFRESCGSDWLRVDTDTGSSVEDVSCVYYPRIPIGRDFVGSMLRTHREWSELDNDAFYESGLSRLIALQQRLTDLSRSASEFLRGLIQEYFPDLSTSFPGEYPGTLWTDTPVGEYVYNVSDLAEGKVFLSRYIAGLRKNGLYDYVDYSTALRLLLQRFERDFGREPSAAEITLLRTNQLRWRQRRLLKLPRLEVATYSKVKTWSATELLYELTLTKEDSDDGVTPITLVDRGITAKLHRLSPARSVRPARLSKSRLVARDFSTILSYSLGE